MHSKKVRNISLLFVIIVFLHNSITTFSQTIPAYELIKTDDIANFLTEDVKQQFTNAASPSQEELAAYFRDVFAERYFFDWHTVDNRIDIYNNLYGNQAQHADRAMDHMQKFADSTLWKLPFSYLNGQAVNAYALRHLARQHKMVDIAFQYFNSGKDPQYINYFVTQMHSLNAALENDSYETLKDGNGVYESFRSGYRVLNWLQIHTLFLGEEAYSDKDQLVTISTLLQHGANLYAINQKFKSGNHQTRGLSALAMLSIIFKDFEGTDLWYKHAMNLLGEHLSKEINADGFQFERSVHYHISDISNYFYVYQLAKKSSIEIDEAWEEKLRSLFNTLVKIAYPDKTAPVLQDDTDNPWAEQNNISEALTLGYLLFEDSEFGYFAEQIVHSRIYWALEQAQLDQLKSIAKQQPQYGSLSFPDTKYYVMRDGWDNNDRNMIISAGVDPKKPDHQHGDILGIQAYANGKVILPNYQVRYSLLDLELFKNSMVKNVAFVDNALQGKQWTSNKGGSGFGKFKQLPNPTTITWNSNNYFDLFVGSHDGFENIGVNYSRQVISVSDEFWIVKDNFTSDKVHDYKQVWQGHYSFEEGSDLIRSTFNDASGCDIFQLNATNSVINSGARGKQWNIVSATDKKDFNFITVIYPYKGYNNRIDETRDKKQINEWKVDDLEFIVSDALHSLTKENEAYLFDVSTFTIDGINLTLSEKSDFFFKITEKQIILHSIAYHTVELTINKSNNNKAINKVLKPGDEYIIK